VVDIAIDIDRAGDRVGSEGEIGMTTTTIDESKLEAFLGQVVGDAGAAISVLLAHLGDKLGLYQAMADGAPVTAAELAGRTGTSERLVQEWLSNQAAGGYVAYDPAADRFRLPAEQAFALAEESSPALVQGGFDFIAAAYQSIGKELEAFRSGTGLAWGDHHPSLFTATERFFRPGYRAHLVQEWIPAMDGVHDKLAAGARVADVGCGYGSSTMVLAGAYPDSVFTGYDYHEPSVLAAREAAAQAGVADRVSFEVADATEIRGPYDLIAFFDCWHDTADPLGVAGAARRALAADGSVMLVEPFAGDRLEDNLTPLGRMSYGASTIACTPCSISDGGPGLGAQAGEARTRELFTRAGFGIFRRVAETPLNVVYQARPCQPAARG
jgi:SAM-dependent methyltransferase